MTKGRQNLVSYDPNKWVLAAYNYNYVEPILVDAMMNVIEKLGL